MSELIVTWTTQISTALTIVMSITCDTKIKLNTRILWLLKIFRPFRFYFQHFLSWYLLNQWIYRKREKREREKNIKIPKIMQLMQVYLKWKIRFHPNDFRLNIDMKDTYNFNCQHELSINGFSYICIQSIDSTCIRCTHCDSNGKMSNVPNVNSLFRNGSNVQKPCVSVELFPICIDGKFYLRISIE